MPLSEHLQSLHTQAVRAINSKQYQQAHQLLVKVLQAMPEHADSYFLLGIINSELGQFKKAIALIDKAIGIENRAEYQVFLAKCLATVGDYTQALRQVALCIDDVSLQFTELDTLGVVLSRIGDHERALVCFERALSIRSDRPATYYNYAVSLKFKGNFDKAASAFNAALALQGDYYQAHFALSDLKLKTDNQARIETLLAQRQKAASDEAHLHIGHALAIEYQQTKQFDKAFEALSRAKQQRCQNIQYTPHQDQVLFAAAKQATLKTTSSQDTIQRPIFVVGMPRSGTTLMERILSNHTQVGSGGELQDFGVALKELAKSPGNLVLDEATLTNAAQVHGQTLGDLYLQKTAIVAPEQARFVDKLPFNFFYLPLIQQALPGAKMICMLRSPMDTCLGNYRQLFSINSPYYQYAYNLSWIGDFYAHFYHLVMQLQHELPNLLIVPYEALVSDPEAWTKKILSHCELAFEPQCLAVESNPLPVSTASKVQVREPINKRSIGRWRQFEKQLAPLAESLRGHGIDLD